MLKMGVMIVFTTWVVVGSKGVRSTWEALSTMPTLGKVSGSAGSAHLLLAGVTQDSAEGVIKR